MFLYMANVPTKYIGKVTLSNGINKKEENQS